MSELKTFVEIPVDTEQCHVKGSLMGPILAQPHGRELLLYPKALVPNRSHNFAWNGSRFWIKRLNSGVLVIKEME